MQSLSGAGRQETHVACRQRLLAGPLLLLLLLLLFVAPPVQSAPTTYVQQSLTLIYERRQAVGGAALIDEQLYSRQLYVYGRHAQQRLSEGHVVVYYERDNEQVAAEMVKNLAMAGIGKLSVFCAGGGGTACAAPRLTSHESLAAYAHELNPLVVTHTVASKAELLGLLAEAGGVAAGETVLVVADASLQTTAELNSAARDLSGGRVRFVAAKVTSLCGLLFNDFSDEFQVSDTEGEGSSDGKEIPLKTAAPHQGPGVKISCIDEESLSFVGLGDSLEMSVDVRASSSSAAAAWLGAAAAPLTLTKTLTVCEVVNTKTVVLRAESGADVDIIVEAVRRGAAVTARKSKRSATLGHAPLERQLVRPAFAPSNGCLPPKKDRAQSLALLAAFRAAESRPAAVSAPASGGAATTTAAAAATLSSFKSSMVAKLLSMGVREPQRSLKDKVGQVGQETIDRVAGRFLRGCAGGATVRKCPATVSVVGSLASQEAIKALTHIYLPVSQFLMFESLDSLMPDGEEDGVEEDGGERVEEAATAAARGAAGGAKNKSKARSDARVAALSLGLPYGAELSQELARLKVFVVGSGAIGCELLKNFAMMGVGASAGTSASLPARPSSQTAAKSARPAVLRARGARHSLYPARGGIVLTDMDHIERSNLNRQLLFRERHVGQPKALVAAESVRGINPGLRVRALTDKVGGGEGGGPFGDAFWDETDVVVTALDNVDARRFVDAQCVRHRKPLLDSGTLGTKGNTQVVLPHVSESYSSSSDPPEEAIPLCTLKSFPYQPEHCVSWARAVFDEHFNADVATLKTLLTQLAEDSPSSLPSSSSSSSSSPHVMSALEELPADSYTRLQRSLECVPLPGQSLADTALCSLRWALALFDDLFVGAVARLVQEHPPNSTDDEGAPFWGGSRRFPLPVGGGAGFNASDPLHVDFVRWAAWMHAKTFGHSTVSEAKVAAFCSADLLARARAAAAGAEPRLTSPAPAPASAASLLQRLTALLRAVGPRDAALLASAWQPEEFEKDDLSLGHVALVASAANLRCGVYGLRGVDQLEVQKVAGKIVPALATTTALVSGLVALELLKLASERVLERRRLRRLRRSELGASSIKGKGGGQQTGAQQAAAAERERVLSRFRNSFVNVARPLLAFAQPVECEAFGVSPRRPGGFSMWDVLAYSPGGAASGRGAAASAATLSVGDVAAFLQREHGVLLQSLSLGDTLLYASFLPGAEERLAARQSLLELLAQLRKEEAEAPGDGDDRQPVAAADSAAAAGAGNATVAAYWDLELVCVDEETGEDRRLPPLRLSTRPAPASKAAAAAAAGAAAEEPAPAETSSDEDKSKDKGGDNGKVEGEAPGSSPTGLRARARAAASRYLGKLRSRLQGPVPSPAKAAGAPTEAEAEAGNGAAAVSEEATGTQGAEK